VPARRPARHGQAAAGQKGVKAKHLRDEAAAGMKGASDVLAKTETEAAPRS
jgi:hypothetical protein